MSEVILIVLGFVANEILRGWFGDSWAKIGRTFRSFLNRTELQAGPEYYHIGYLRTDVHIVQGTGELEYSEDGINAVYRDGSPDNPDDIADRIIAKELELDRAHREGNAKAWDGIGIGLSSFDLLKSDDEKKLRLNVQFYKSRYAAFEATVVAIGTEDRQSKDSIFAKHLRGRAPNQLVPYLARHIGVLAVVITSDHQVVTTRRSGRVRARPDQFDASVAEGIDPLRDSDTSGPVVKIDLYKAVMRGCAEELGLKLTRSQISLLGFGVDMSFYQYLFFAVARTDKTYAELRSLRNGKAEDAWESTIQPIPYNIRAVLEFVRDHRMWGAAKVAYYWALLHQHDRGTVEAQAFAIMNGQAANNSAS